ncbi:MAG TPA: NADH-quinone oxidoreductase subunit C [Acidobacteriaceae bacterium]|jgi:NADH-quinone oxidoreductase subunit C
MSDPATQPATPAAAFGKEAVLAALPDHAAINGLGDLINDAKWDRGELTLDILAENIVAACKAAQTAGYNFFEDCTCVDWYPAEPRFQVTYHILSHKLKQRIRLISRVSGDTPTIDSITSIWPAANFYEREVFDLFGVNFAGHPRLTRIMMPDNWNGHPLRKDYPVEGYR